MLKASVILGTRPEAIKLAPVILALKSRSDAACHVCVTAQHREMLDRNLAIFGIVPDADLNLMRQDHTLAQFTSRAIAGLDHYLREQAPQLVIVQGDTTTVFCATLAAFYHRIPVAHVEAGLRTGSLTAPWPEEANRVLTTRLATLHFAPTERTRQNLLAEGVSPGKIFVTGNTVIDALFLAVARVHASCPTVPGLPAALQPSAVPVWGDERPEIVLITGHRRENFGAGFQSICAAIANLAKQFPGIHFVYPVHLNPNVRSAVSSLLGAEAGLSNVHLLEPLDYLPFVALMDRAKLILTDSGGVQEEAPSLGKPVLVMRDTTERPEAVEAGTARLVGTDQAKIIEEATAVLSTEAVRGRGTGGGGWDSSKLPNRPNPYGDGRAAERIVRACMEAFAG